MILKRVEINAKGCCEGNRGFLNEREERNKRAMNVCLDSFNTMIPKRRGDYDTICYDTKATAVVACSLFLG